MAGKSDRIKADLVLILVAAVWARGCCQRSGGQYVGFFVFGAARYILGALVMIPFIRRFNIPRRYLLWTF
jgi:hypothetical protein